MNSQTNKALKISEDIHQRIKNLCDKKGYKIYKWTAKILLKALKKEESENEEGN